MWISIQSIGKNVLTEQIKVYTNESKKAESSLADPPPHMTG